MGRRLKQFIYGTGFLVVFFAIGFGIYVLVFRGTPTCSDGRQNGKETGIDCGGACAPCAQTYAQNVTVGRVYSFAAGTRVVVAAEVSNPNDEYGFRIVRCVMAAVNGQGAVIGSTESSEFIYDRKTKGTRFIVGAIDILNGVVDDIRVTCTGSDIVARTDFIEPNVVVQRSTTDRIESQPISVSGSIKNNGIVVAAKSVVVGFLYDASGIPLGVSRTELDAVQPTEERAFKLRFPATIPVDQVDATKTRLFVDSIK